MERMVWLRGKKALTRRNMALASDTRVRSLVAADETRNEPFKLRD